MTSEFVITLVDERGSRRELALTLPETPTGAQLFEALGSRVQSGPTATLWVERTASEITKTQSVVELLHGDVVHAGRGPQRQKRYQLVSESSGSTRQFEKSLTVGRRSGTVDHLQLADRTVSGRHAEITVDSGHVVVRDLGSSNGTFVNGVGISSHRLTSGDKVEFGSASRFRFVDTRPSATTGSNAKVEAGRIQLNRPPRNIVTAPSGTIRLGPAPPKRRSRRFPWATVALPILAGAAMYFGLGRNPVFLIIIAMSPAIAIWNFFETRGDDARQHAERVEHFQAGLNRARQDLGQSEQLEQSWYRSVLPDTASILSRIESGQNLWDRMPTHDDFGWIRVGTGPVERLRTLEIDENGDPEMVAAARELREATSTPVNRPVGLRLLSDPVVGIVGRSEQVGAVVANAVFRLAARHSPSEVAVAVLSANPALEWMKWLPHTNSVPGLDTAAVVDGAGNSDTVLTAIVSLVERRLKGEAVGLGYGGIPLPHVVVIAAQPVPVAPAQMSSIASLGARAGVSVIHVAPTAGALPNDCRAILSLDGQPTLRRPVEGTVTEMGQVDVVDPTRAEALARQTAAYVDVNAQSRAASIPNTVSLCDINNLDATSTVDSVLAAWRSAPSDVFAPVGRTAESVVELSFAATREGPHLLVAGTTRAGKSEFLQALVGGLSVRYSPEHLNLLFVDWKGAATFSPFLDLPHCVGLLSDLQAGQAGRALISLGAEIDYRKRVLAKHGAQKLDDLPPGTLPRLIVLFDEFAELLDNNPDFADGVVSVAQTGGSLGVHMVLAMQTPSAALNKRVENCINGRIVFRLQDKTESSSALSIPDAADIPASIPGRGFIKDGSNRILSFQSAYGGMVSSGDTDQLAAFTVGPHSRPNPTPQGRTDLSVLVDLAQRASQHDPVELRPPWVEPLPEVLSLRELPSQEAGRRGVRVGLLDDPAKQTRRPYLLDLQAFRNVLIVGSGGTGRTSTLRSMVAALAEDVSPERLSIYIIDYGAALDDLDAVPHVGGVVAGAETERLRRLLNLVSRLIEDRKQRAPTETGDPEDPRQVVLIVDGLDSLNTELTELDDQNWIGWLQQVLGDGPALGVHVIAATNNPMQRPTLLNLFGERLALRLQRDGYTLLAMADLTATSSGPGRALSLTQRLEFQIALTSRNGQHDRASQAAAVRERWSGSVKVAAPVEVLPKQIRLPLTMNPKGALSVVAGFDDVSLDPLHLDLARQPLVAVMGPDLSGRTTTVAAIRDQLAANGPLRSERLLVSGATDSDSGWSHEARGADDILTRLELINSQPFDGATLVAFDDVDPLFDLSPAASPEEREKRKVLDQIGQQMIEVIETARQRRNVVVIAGRLTDFSRGQGWLKRVREAKQAVVLMPADLRGSAIDPVFAVRFPRRTGYQPRPGLGVLARGAQTSLIQVARTERSNG